MTEQAIDVRFELRDCLFVLGELDPIFTYLQEAEILAQSLNDQPRLERIAVNMLHSFGECGQYDRAVESGHRALAIAASLQDFALEVWTNLHPGYVYQTLGDYQRAVDVTRRNVELLGGELIHERLNLPFLPSVFSATGSVGVLSSEETSQRDWRERKKVFGLPKESASGGAESSRTLALAYGISARGSSIRPFRTSNTVWDSARRRRYRSG
ncbi:MAG: hypothetical protein ACE5MG_11825 [Candidatus Methylomirabilales bacterium]